MTRTFAKVLAATAFVVGGLAACGGSDDEGTQPSGNLSALYAQCGDGCAAGLTCTKLSDSLSICTQPCGNGCPGDGVCSIDKEGNNICTRPCSVPPGSKYNNGYACRPDGSYVPCTMAEPGLCTYCGCAPSDRCEAGSGCVPKAEEGTPCKRNEDCKSDNCGNRTGVCNVPLGSPCSEHCDWCRGDICTKECDSLADVNKCSAGWICVKYNEVWTECRVDCEGKPTSAKCADKCTSFSSGDGSYCPMCEDCPLKTGKGIHGISCLVDATCVSQICSVGHKCTDHCSADSECPTGELCVDTVKGEQPTCIGACEPGCKNCRSGKSVSGAMTTWCDNRLPKGMVCMKPQECASDVCQGGYCG